MEQRIPGYCALCISRCGCISVVENGILRSVEPFPDHPTGQALCIKGKAAPELVYSPQRILSPLKRTKANVPGEHAVDGMDLSHNLFDSPGKDREIFAMAFEGGVYFVRDERFRLHEDGRFYDVSVASNELRYNMNVVSDSGRHASARRRLQRRLDQFMAIKQTDTSYTIVPSGTNGDNFKNAQDRAAKGTSGNVKRKTD